MEDGDFLVRMKGAGIERRQRLCCMICYCELVAGRTRKKYAGSEKPSPHQIRKRSHFGTGRSDPPPPAVVMAAS